MLSLHIKQDNFLQPKENTTQTQSSGLERVRMCVCECLYAYVRTCANDVRTCVCVKMRQCDSLFTNAVRWRCS
jgi:hypothetical protein